MTQNVDNIIPQIIMITRQQRLWLLLLFTVFFRVIAEGGPTIRGNVYGGGNLADVKTNTEVNISSGQVEGNVYGGGNVGSVGTYTTSSDMKTFTFTANTGECSVTISGNAIIGTGVDQSDNGTFANGNVYGAGKGEADTYWCEKAMAYKTNVTINAGTIGGTVYGGGQIGRVENDATVIIGVETPADHTVTPIIAGNVFGAGAGLATHGYSALLRGDAEVTIQGYAQVGLSVYGGGEKASVGRFKIVGGLPSEPQDGGTCKVTVNGHAKVGANGTGHNIFGSCQGVAAPASLTAYDKYYKSMQAKAQKEPDANTKDTAWEWVEGSVEGSEEYYWEYYPTLDAYKGFLNTLALASHTDVEVGGSASVYGSVFGGGQMGITLGNVAVDITGGTIYEDVYGGGALADTNKGNQTAEKYDEATVTEGVTVVTGMYTLSGTTYTEITEENTVAQSGTTYYTKRAQSAIHPTTVNLTGGAIHGDAYGGGLGQKNGFNGKSGDVEAIVWGDISVNLGSSGGSTATAFYITNYDTPHSDVVKSGRVFGCNNLLGSPKGDVKVTVWKTVAGSHTRTADSDEDGVPNKNTAENPVTPSYEVAAVYGGGNLANYTTTGKKAYVRIETCDVSIRDVYGGGNAAEVPGTDVLVRGAYEIQEVFGGGNGNDPYTTDGGTTWVDNPGANIGNSATPGNATTLLTGGYVHEAYGGSNKRGTVFGNVSIDMGTGSVSENTNGACTLDVEKLVGAGKDADVNGDLIMVMGCKPDVKTPVLYAGADNANVNGDVELTITSGNFGKVFGGNNAGGIIMGHIILNIEETGECDVPIEIDELYLGGNEAMYSQYGYYKDGNTYKPRTAEMAAITDPNATGYTPAVTTAQYGTEVRKTAPYDAPKLNIVSCTYIGQVFGGGYGTKATLYGDPIVNINMIKGSFADNTTNGVPAKMTALSLPSTENINHLGIIGTVYGGGNAADVNGNTTVNIGTASTVDLVSTGATNQTVLGAYITGNVYGGGKGEAKTTAGTAGEAFLCAKAMVNGGTGTQVNIGNGYVGGNVYGGGEVGRVDNNTEVTIGLASGTSAPIINGNVFGAGKGVNTHGYSALVRGTSTVTVQADAKVRGSVYGGGEIASVGKYKVGNDGLPEVLDNSLNSYSGYCYVTIKGNAEIGPDNMEMTKAGGPSDAGHVFGGGKGVLPYEGYDAANATPLHMDGTKQEDGSWEDNLKEYPAYDATKALDADYAKFIKSLALATQTLVTVSGNPFIKGSVYGGSENGFVQKDTRVVVSGGQIGNGYVQMDDDGNYLAAANRYSVNRRYTDAEWSAKHLIKDGETNYASSLPECASWPYGQAAAAADRYAPYDKDANTTGDLTKYANGNLTEGGRAVGDDGHTFFGNVFGGGSGYYPYKPGRWFEDAGAVYGNTQVDITGGHILTNVYGANEMTDVGKYAVDSNGKPTTVTSGGKCTINMSGGTIGVPRTVEQIDAHPVTCFLFGAGKGDQRVFFNRSTNVGDVEVNITGGTIYGSVFGGGEDGHVMRDVKLTIENTAAANEGEDPTIPTIGTSGVSGEDGNVFGGGRGFAGNAYTAGNVAGSVKMEIKGGNILGSIFGGGQLASVGYGLFESTNTANYGVMQEDIKDDTGTTTQYYTQGAVGLGRGYVDITISGGTIGNTHEYEYIVPNTSNIPTGLAADYSTWTAANWTTWKEHNSIPKTEFDTATGRLSHTKGGNVFAGGMGRFYQLDGTSFISSVDWRKLGCVKSTKLTITGGTIKSNVYGGGELGQVVGYRTVNGDNLSTNITIEGDNTKIGTEVKDGGVTQYTFGSVYGSGYGSLLEEITLGDGTTKTNPKFEAGLVKYDTKVDMQGGKVLASIYGGGEVASVGFSTDIAGQTFTVEGNDKDGKTITTTVQKTNVVGSTHVSVRGSSQVGIAPITLAGGSKRYFGGAKMGNVYGGGSGHANAVRTGKVFKNANVSISGSPTIYHNIYGGGAYGTVGDFGYVEGNENVDVNGETVTVKKVFGVAGVRDATSGVATVTITGGTIGVDGHENGMVFGSSRGDINAPWERDDHTAWVNTANVTIGTAATGTQGQEGYVAASGPHIKGSVYGSGENGHTFNNTVVTVNGGTIGIESGAPVTSNGVEYSGAAYPYRGNVYGGGCGTDKYYSGKVPDGHTSNDGGGDTFNALAGVVYGTTTVNINGGTVVRNVYGAGAMGSVGKAVTTTTTEGETTTTTTTITGGTTTINVSGGTIGVDGTVGDGNVFGAARGDVDATISDYALARKSTDVYVTGGTVKGNVYGGGELGCVGTFTVSSDMNMFTWQDTDGSANTAANTGNKNTGICNVTVDGSSAIINGHVFGAGKGKDDTFWCEKGIAYKTVVHVSNGTVGKNVYGGGEVGRVETDTEVKVGLAASGGGTSEPTVNGSVFGGGAGVETHGYSALVRGNTTVTIDQKAHVTHSVYGGGEIASVGKYGLDEQKMPSILKGGGYCYVTVQGNAMVGADVFGAGEGVKSHFDNSNTDLSKRSRRMTLKSDWESRVGADRFDWDYLNSESAYSTYLETLALATHPEVTIDGSASVGKSVYGGGELGLTKGSVIVNIQGGTITEDVYGGGSLANTNTTTKADLNNDGTLEDVTPTTTVNLKGGTITRNVYGGGLGRLAKGAVAAVFYTAEEATAYNTEHGLSSGDEGYVSAGDVKTPAADAVSAVEAKVFGTVLVELNKPTEGTTTTYGDCVVKGNIFGCNNLNGSPQKDVTVHVYSTTDYTGHEKDAAKSNTKYNVAAVYGGGNLAAYYPDDATARASAKANVIIDGCDLTSIETVYGGGNAASVPATEVTVNGTYEIGEVFGGGNGKDDVSYDGGTTYVTNPGANVGYLAYTSDSEKASKAYGTGKAHATIYGGTVHAVYGGSNTKGNVRVESRTTLEDAEECTFNVGEAYGGGHNAPQDGDAILEIGCISGMEKACGGAAEADVNGNVVLNITNGTYGQVFGGNDLGGLIRGAITVNIEETGCRPVIIGELYGGGNQARYSVYGYNDDGSVKTSGSRVADPQVNVHSFTSIGNVFGGGYGEKAVMVGDPHVNINVTKGKYAETYKDSDNVVADDRTVYDLYPVPSHAKGAIGAINNVFGGGNAAKVIGNPTVNIGTEAGDEVYEPVTEALTAGTTSVVGYYTVSAATGTAVEGTTYYEKIGGRYSPVTATLTVGSTSVADYYTVTAATGTAVANTTYYEKKTVAVDIRGNVFGGGNNAEVEGDTDVVVGKRK
ncbi:MAG: hypothetical protein IJP74_06095 [Prevotella sp.]|nr:hypothetical protein [Prevotella sp.]